MVNDNIVFKTKNLYANRELFFVSDAPHLLKTARNNLYFSHARSGAKRMLKVCADTMMMFFYIFEEFRYFPYNTEDKNIHFTHNR